MLNKELTFGELISSIRISKDITLREMARKLDIAASYLSDIEKGNRNPPEKEKIDTIAAILNFTKEELELAYDLTGKARETVPPDLVDYIKDRDYVIKVLRKAMEQNVEEKEWKKFLEFLNQC